MNIVYAPGTVFVQSKRNEGPGYGTEASPTASSSIQAGAATSTDVFWLFQALGAGLGYGGGPPNSWPPRFYSPPPPPPAGAPAGLSCPGPHPPRRPGPRTPRSCAAGVAG